MSTVKRICTSAARRLERGSALLMSLMVMVGLSLLGLAFVAISESESAISVNERNHTQTVAIAEAGAREIVEWFQDPEKARGLALMPANDSTFKTNRIIDTYTGMYKSEGDLFLCDLPYGPNPNDLLLGEEASADVIINRSTAEGRTFLNDFNDKMLGDEPAPKPRIAGEITEIRIFAPPILGANLVTDPATGHRFWSGGTRYGVATIMVRSEKFDKQRSDASRRSVARAECRIVVSQFPLPVPQGPLQTQQGLVTNGNFNVHWGMVTAQQNLDLQKDYTSLPWVNAYERIHFERGYDSSIEFAANTAVTVGQILRPTAARIAANPALRFHEYRVASIVGLGNLGATEPAATGGGAWPTTPNSTLNINGQVNVIERAPTAYPITGASNDTNRPWLYWIAKGDIAPEDPWFQARAAGLIVSDPNTNSHPYPFPYGTPATYGATHHFMSQDFNQYPDFRQVVFPSINYDFWKATAIAGHGNGDVYYLRWVSGENYTDGVDTKTFEEWTADPDGGFFFFETQNQQNPQNGGSGTLAPQVSPAGGVQYLSGFIYLNAPFGSKGLTNTAGQFNQPGEPYMDIGYRKVALTSVGSNPAGSFVMDASGQPVIDNAFNNQWDYEDLPWSNTGGTGPGGVLNEEFDVYVQSRNVTSPAGGAPYDGYFVVPYVPGCKPGKNSCGGCNCSEPHEPYLNVLYDGVQTGGGGLGGAATGGTLTIGWQNPATQTRIPKRTQDPTDPDLPGGPTDTLVTCTSTSKVADCTSDAYDVDGGMVGLTVATNGVLYMEGTFDSTGNAQYFGAVLAGSGGVDPKGTPNIWYDDRLSRGDWRPDGIPRVLITSVETDR